MGLIDRLNEEHDLTVQKVQIVSKKYDAADIVAAFLMRGFTLGIGSFATSWFLNRIGVSFTMLDAFIGMCALYWIVQFARGK